MILSMKSLNLYWTQLAPMGKAISHRTGENYVYCDYMSVFRHSLLLHISIIWRISFLCGSILSITSSEISDSTTFSHIMD